MIKITFPDGSVREYEAGVTGLQIAESISARLAQDVLACSVNDEIVELNRPINEDASIRLHKWDDAEAKHAFWHTSAHLLAEALQELYPNIQFGIGPAIENGFYYDVDPGEGVTIKESEAISFMQELKAGGVRVCGGSSLKHDYNVKAQLTATQRVGVHKYTFPKGGDGRVILDLNHGIYNYDGKTLWASIRVESPTLITGYRITNGWARTNYTYFAIQFSQPIKNYGYKDLQKILYNGFWRKFPVNKNFPEETVEPHGGYVHRGVQAVLFALLYDAVTALDLGIGQLKLNGDLGGNIQILNLLGIHDLNLNNVLVGHIAEVNQIILSAERMSFIFQCVFCHFSLTSEIAVTKL